MTAKKKTRPTLMRDVVYPPIREVTVRCPICKRTRRISVGERAFCYHPMSQINQVAKKEKRFPVVCVDETCPYQSQEEPMAAKKKKKKTPGY